MENISISWGGPEDSWGLQFGHGAEAVENYIAQCGKTQRDKLQFGHGAEAVENAPPSLPSTARPRGFNSATALRPWRTAAVQAAEEGVVDASIRPRR